MEIRGKKKCSGAIVFAEEPKTQVIEFDLKTFGCKYLYIGVYSVVPNTKVKMAYSVRKNECEMTLNLELWRQHKDEFGNQIKVKATGGHHGHHHHHKDNRPSYNKCEDCILCKGKCSKLKYRK